MHESDPCLNASIKSNIPPQPTNLQYVRNWYHEFTSTQGVITGTSITGTWYFQYTTGMNEEILLNDLKLHAECACHNGAGAVVAQYCGNEIGAMISRATFYIGNVRVAESSNYWADALLTKLICYDETDLRTQNLVYHVNGYTGGPAAKVDNQLISFTDRLDGLWFPDESNKIGPNTTFRLELQMEPNAEILMALHDAQANLFQKQYSKFVMTAYSRVTSQPAPDIHMLRLITPLSYRTADAAAYTNTFTVNPNCVGISLFKHASVEAIAPLNAKAHGVVGQPVTGFMLANRLTHLLIKYGQQSLPSYNIAIPFAANIANYEPLWTVMMDTLRSTRHHVPNYDQWLTKPFFHFPVVKSTNDKSGMIVELQMTSAGALAGSSLYVCIHLQNFVTITYDQTTQQPSSVVSSI